MLGPPGRRPAAGARRRRFLLPIAVLAVLLAVVVGEVSYQVVGSARQVAVRSSRSWVAAVAPLVDESNALVPTLRQIRNSASALSRAQLDSLLAELTSGADAVSAQLGSLELAPPTPASGAALAAAFTARARASVELAGALRLAASAGGPGTGALALQRLGAVAAALAASDADYRRFRRLLPRGSGGSRLPHSVWLPAPHAWGDASLGVWVSELTSAGTLSATRRVSLLAVSLEPRAIAIRGLPSPPPSTTTTSTTTSTSTSTTLAGTSGATTTTAASTRKKHRRTPTTSSSTTTTSTTTTLQIPPPGAVSVIPATAKLYVSVLVASSGDLAAPGVVVAATLTPESAAAGVAASGTGQATRQLGTLAPGAARDVHLPALAVHGGGRYRLQVVASLAGGATRTATLNLTVEP